MQLEIEDDNINSNCNNIFKDAIEEIPLLEKAVIGSVEETTNIILDVILKIKINKLKDIYYMNKLELSWKKINLQNKLKKE